MKRWLALAIVLVVAGISLYLVRKPAKAPIQRPELSTTTPTPTSTPNTTTTDAAPTASSSPAIATAAPGRAAAQGPRVRIGSLTIPVYLARTPAETEKGLSGRISLAPDKGMLFIFPVAADYKFWMPDMHFPIDIIWISSAKKILGVSANASNDFDPSNPTFYIPPSPAQYVLETNAGFAARNGLGAGDSITFLGI